MGGLKHPVHKQMKKVLGDSPKYFKVDRRVPKIKGLATGFKNLFVAAGSETKHK